jgi:hypothetical protein
LDTLVPCLVCGKQLKNLTSSIDANQPTEGTAFATSGHYGSIYDPMEGSRKIEINICNPCLKTAQQQQRVLEFEVKRTVTATATIWS